MATPALAERQMMWEIIRDRRQIVLADLLTVASRHNARAYLHRLCGAGIMTRTGGDVASPANPGIYQLTRDVGQRAPRVAADGALLTKPTQRERLWAAIRPLRAGWTVGELAMLARVSPATATDYVIRLARAGVLTKSGRPCRYRLAPGADTGPLAPRVLADGRVYDPNSERTVGAAVLATEKQGDRVWAALRQHAQQGGPSPTIADLTVLAEPATIDRVRVMMIALVRVGIVVRDDGGCRPYRYRLAPGADTGPLAPAISKKDRTVTDRNTGRVYPPKGAA